MMLAADFLGLGSDAQGLSFDESIASSSASQAASQAAAEATTGAWIAQGPAPTLNGQLEPGTSPNRQVTGAIHTVVAHPTDPNTLYIGAVNGGIWKTSDATAENPTWVPQSDFLETLSIGAMAFDPTDTSHQTLVAGTARYSSFAGFGGQRGFVFRTTNGGDNWTQATSNGLTATNENLSGIAARGETIVVSSSGNLGGIFRSTDAGENFTPIDGADFNSPGDDFSDLVEDPSDPSGQRLYTASLGVGGSGGIYRSDDFGVTWTKITGPGIDAEMDELLGDANNIEMAVHETTGRLYIAALVSGQPRGVFHSSNASSGSPTWTRMDVPVLPFSGGTALIGATNATPIVITSNNHGLGNGDFVVIDGVNGNEAANGFHRVTVVDANQFSLNDSVGSGNYTDGGVWVRVANPNPRTKDIDETGAQGRIHFSITTDPTNENILYIGGDRQDRPGNPIGDDVFGGAIFRGDASITRNPNVAPSPQWDHLTHDIVGFDPSAGTANGTAPHADSREMTFDANGDLIEVDDGGIYRRTSPRDNTGDWFTMAGSLAVVEFHDVAYDDNTDTLIGGTQDNGTHFQQEPGNLIWDFLSGGDGGDVIVDSVSLAAENQSVRYSSSQNLGGFRRTTWDQNNNLIGTTFPALTVTSGPAFGRNFSTPVQLNEINPQKLLFIGSNGVYESPDQGATMAQVHPDNLGFLQDAVDYGGFKDGVANEDVFYVGFGRDVAVRTDDSGTVNVTSPGSGTIRDVIMNPNDWENAFAIDNNQVFQTNDAGQNWIDITGDLMSMAGRILQTVEYIPGSVGGLLVGGALGTFVMQFDRVGEWTEVATNLPNVLVYDLIYNQTDDVLVAGTLGRGAWTLPNASFLGEPLITPEINVQGGDPALDIADGDTTPDTNDGTDFTSVTLTTGQRSNSFTIQNFGTGVLDVSAISITGVAAADFQVLNFTPTLVAVDGSLSFDVVFDPTELGPRTATVEILSDDGDESPYDFQIVGTGIEDSVLNQLVINEVLTNPIAGERGFDTDGDGTFEATDEFIELYNTSSETVDLSGLQFWNNANGGFHFIPVGASLGPRSFLLVANDVADGALPRVATGSLAMTATGNMDLGDNGDNIVIYDPRTDEFLQSIYEADDVDEPATEYATFSPTASRLGSVGDLGTTTAGTSRALSPDGQTNMVTDHVTIDEANILASPGIPNRGFLEPFVVDILEDEIDGDFSIGDFSLREAIELAEVVPGPNDILFDPALSGGNIVQSGGQFAISEDVAIFGLGADQLSVTNVGNSRLFDIQDSPTVAISGLTLSDGIEDADGEGGGAIRSTGDLFLTDVTLMNNAVSGANADGGAILHSGPGFLSIVGSHLTNNRVSGINSNGGAIALVETDSVMSDSLIEDNLNEGNGVRRGGGIAASSGSLTLENLAIRSNSIINIGGTGGGVAIIDGLLFVNGTTISDNDAEEAGGGVFHQGLSALGVSFIDESTISGNRASVTGGGIQNEQGRLEIISSTVTNNEAVPGFGSGILTNRFAIDPTQTTLASTIVAGNVNSDLDDFDSRGASTVSLGFNVFGIGSGVSSATGLDQIGFFDPRLAELANNGGSTATHALLPGSPALDLNLTGGATGFDQRGNGFSRLIGAGVDAGSYESAGFDFGDAPQSFLDALTSDASHEAVGPRLGATRDTEATSQPSDDSNADGVDEDGVMFGQIDIQQSLAAVNIDLQNAESAFVDAWVDWDQDGIWQDDERILNSAPVIAGMQTLNFVIPADAQSGATNARVRLSTAGGLDVGGFASDGEVEDSAIEVVRLPRVEGIEVNGGDAQRSSVTEISVQFDHLVEGTTDAFQVTNRDSGNAVENLDVRFIDIGGKTQAVIQFNPGASVIDGSTTNTLADGNYQLEILSALIHEPGNSANTLAEDVVFGDQASDLFFRFLGDSDGDRDVDGQDYGRFGLTFLRSSNDPDFEEAFDSDRDGDIDGQDYGRFGTNFLSRLDF